MPAPSPTRVPRLRVPASRPARHRPHAPTETIAATETSFKVAITVREGLASWLRVSADGRKAWEGTLLGGEVREYLVSDTATLTIGKPSAVVVTRNGKPVTVPKEANAQVVLSAGK